MLINQLFVVQVFIRPFVPFAIMDKSGVISTSSRSQRGESKSSQFNCSKRKCPIGELSEQEFCARFYIFDSIFIQLADREALSIDKLPHNMVYFTKEQFAVGLRLPILSLVKQFLHFSKIPPAFIHPNIVQILMGCSVLDAPYQLNLSLLEVSFVYIIKMSPKERFSLWANILSLHFVIELSDSRKGRQKDTSQCPTHGVDQLRVSTSFSNLLKPLRFQVLTVHEFYILGLFAG